MRDLFDDPLPPSTARFSPCGVYRYELRRYWRHGTRPLVCAGLNPSTADAEQDDPTIRRDIGFGKLWHCDFMIKINAYAFRATDPKVMQKAAVAGFDVIGPDNDRWILEALTLVRDLSGILLVSWGKNIGPERQIEMATLIEQAGVVPMCLGTNKNGTPVHELYQPYESQLEVWEAPRAA